MRFLGRLSLVDEPGPGLDVVMVIDDSTVRVTAGDEPVGSWPILTVHADRAEGDFFWLRFGEEEFRFLPRNRLAFAYEGLQAIEDGKTRQSTGWRGTLRKLRRDPAVAGQPEPGPDSPPAEPVTTPSAPPHHPGDGIEPHAPNVPAGPPARLPDGPGPAQEPPPSESGQDRPDAPSQAIPAAAGDLSDAVAAEASSPDPFAGDEVLIDLRHEPAGTEGPEADDPASEGSDVGEAPRIDDHSDDSSSGRVGLIRRVRRPSTRRTREDHTHTYVETRFAGGLVRRVCTECRHVSIGSD